MINLFIVSERTLIFKSIKFCLTTLTRLTFDFQDRLSFIGPEEFIQTFAMKDPLENHKVGLHHGQVTTASGAFVCI